MRKLLVFAIIIFMSITLSGCGAKREEVDFYRSKQLLASSFTNLSDEEMYEDFNNKKIERMELIFDAQELSKKDLLKSPKLMRKIAFAWGEGDIKYHIVLPGDTERYVITTFNATTITTYNISYILNLPAKLISNIRVNWQLKENIGNENIVTNSMILVFMLYDIYHTLIGLFLAIILIPVGIGFGFIQYPIKTIIDFIPCMIGLVSTLYYAIINIFY